jgi:hypothetical protein
MAESKRLERLQKEMEDLKLKMREENKRIKDQERKDDQRRKFILGAICIEHAEINLDFRAKLESLLRAHVPDGDKHLWPALFAANDNAPPEDDARPAPTEDEKEGTAPEGLRLSG